MIQLMIFLNYSFLSVKNELEVGQKGDGKIS